MMFQSFFQNTDFANWVQVVHRLPGRLRLMIPVLVYVANGYEKYTAEAKAFIERLPGMESVSPNLATRNLLFRYDPTTVSESELLGWLEDLVVEGFKNYGEQDGEAGIHMKLNRLMAHLNACVDKIRTKHAAKQENRTASEIENSARH